MTRQRAATIGTRRHRRNSLVIVDPPTVEHHHLKHDKERTDLKKNVSTTHLHTLEDHSTEKDLLLWPLTNEENREYTDYVKSELLYPYINEVLDFESYQTLDTEANDVLDETLEYFTHVHDVNGSLLQETQDIIDQLNDLQLINESIINQTKEFHETSNKLITETNEDRQLYNGIMEILDVFNQLDPIIHKLNTTSSSGMVNDASFAEILTKLDFCMQFLETDERREFKEYAKYKTRFRQCLIRALTLIRNYVIETFKEYEPIIVAKLTEDADLSLLQKKLVTNEVFTEDLGEKNIIRLISYLNERYSAGDEEISNLLKDIYAQYFRLRWKLVHFLVEPLLLEIKENSLDTSLKHFDSWYGLLSDEKNLLESFFTGRNDLQDQQLNQWLAQVISPLHEILKGEISKVHDVEELKKLLNELQPYRNTSTGGDEDDDELNLNKFFQPAINDFDNQYLTQIHQRVTDSIINYQPSLKEPKLSGASLPVYPPILEVSAILEESHLLISKASFDHLANTLVHISILSILKNYGGELNYKPDKQVIARKLFVIRSLLHLKNELQTKYAFIDFGTASKNTSITSVIRHLFHKSNPVFEHYVEHDSTKTSKSRKDLRLWFLPAVLTQDTDSFTELSLVLHKIINEFIVDYATKIIQDIDPQNMLDTLTYQISNLSTSISTNIEDKKIAESLIERIQGKIVDEYEARKLPDNDRFLAFFNQAIVEDDT
ncbi:BA75_03261T0 [Komagataella pastoris]|uniref:Conserved oligomeric Golgi complex subunit 3 n=1 Tax=Komagataella pastoris TaxID=4922 RepID=A0A1B2JDA0_PICPA|nr:BA75_03261T0 [Komagataella pastoris]